jgi:peroxiredoxin family protein
MHGRGLQLPGRRARRHGRSETSDVCGELGIGFVACEMAMHILGTRKEDLIDEVTELTGVSTFLDRSRDAKIIFI